VIGERLRTARGSTLTHRRSFRYALGLKTAHLDPSSVSLRRRSRRSLRLLVLPPPAGQFTRKPLPQLAFKPCTSNRACFSRRIAFVVAALRLTAEPCLGSPFTKVAARAETPTSTLKNFGCLPGLPCGLPTDRDSCVRLLPPRLFVEIEVVRVDALRAVSEQEIKLFSTFRRRSKNGRRHAEVRSVSCSTSSASSSFTADTVSLPPIGRSKGVGSAVLSYAKISWRGAAQKASDTDLLQGPRARRFSQRPPCRRGASVPPSVDPPLKGPVLSSFSVF
jgi:hypothetical protein